MDEPKMTPDGDGIIIRKVWAYRNQQGIDSSTNPCILRIEPGSIFTIKTLPTSSPERMVGVLLYGDIEIVFVPTYAILLYPEHASIEFNFDLARHVAIEGTEYYLTWEYGKPFTIQASYNIDESFKSISRSNSVAIFNREQMGLLYEDMELAMQISFWLYSGNLPVTLIYACGRND